MSIKEQWREIVGNPGLGSKFTEKQLQEYISLRLKKYGFTAQLEVKLNDGKADIVSDWQDGAIIEVKKYLDRSSIYQAVGQLSLYGLKNERVLAIAGFHPTDNRERESALTTASMVEQINRVQVLFI